MKNINCCTAILKIAVVASLLSYAACSSSPSTPSSSSFVSTGTPAAATPAISPAAEKETAQDGLDLQAVGEIARKSKNAEDLERLLNQPNAVNNLDLDENGKVDYINVTEFKDGTTPHAKGYSLSVDLGENNIQEIATILLERDNAKDKIIDVSVVGNEEIYGTDDVYAGTWDYNDSPFSSYSYGTHPYYSSPYHYGYYPSYYSPYNTISRSSYRTNMQASKSNSIFKKIASVATKAKLVSPNYGKSAANIKAPLSKPTVAQQSYQKLNPSRTAPRSTVSTTSGSSGSGRSSSSSSSSSSKSSIYSSSSSSSKSTGSSSSSRSSSSRSRRK